MFDVAGVGGCQARHRACRRKSGIRVGKLDLQHVPRHDLPVQRRDGNLCRRNGLVTHETVPADEWLANWRKGSSSARCLARAALGWQRVIPVSNPSPSSGGWWSIASCRHALSLIQYIITGREFDLPQGMFGDAMPHEPQGRQGSKLLE